MNPRVLLLVGLLLLPLSGAGQEKPPLTLQKYTRAHGLPSNYVLCLFQDRDGFLWFGTDSGAARYDGRSFETFTTNDGLPSNFIYSIAQTPDGRLWFGTFEGGLAAFDGLSFTTYPISDDPARNNAEQLATDAFGRVYVRTSHGAWLLEQDSLRLFPSPAEAETVYHLQSLADGDLLIAHDTTLVRLRPTPTQHDTVGRFPLPAGTQFLQAEQERTGALLALLNPPRQIRGNLHRLDFGDPSPSLQHGTRLSSHAITLATMPSGAVIAGGRMGLDYLTESTHVYYGDEDGTGYVTALLVDYEGALWIGTHGGGAAKLAGTHLHTYTDPLLAGNLLRLHQDTQGHVWAMGERGLGRLDARTLHPHYTASAQLPTITLTDQPNTAFSFTNGVYLYTNVPFSAVGQVRGRISRFTLAMLPDWFSSLHYDTTGDTLWAGTFGHGIFRFHADRPLDTLTTADGLPTNMIEGIARTSDALWFLTRSHGVTRYRNGRMRTFTTRDGLPSNAVFSVYEQRDGTVWFGTDEGIAYLREERVQAPRGNRALSGRRVIAFFEYGAAAAKSSPHLLYAIGERYLHQVRPDSVRMLATFRLLPDPGTTINDALYQPDHDRLLLATSGGLVGVDLAQLSYAATPPRVAIVRVQEGTRPLPLPTDRTVPLRLPHTRDNLTITFAPLSFVNEAATRVQYRLNDRPWSAPTDMRQLSLLNLPHGLYTLTVRAINADGVVSTTPAVLRFEIVPPFWRRTWFLLLLFAGATGLLTSAVRHLSTRKLRTRLRQMELERRVQHERERISHDLHDHVGAQLSTIVSAIDLARMAARPAGPAATHLDQLEAYARRTMTYLRETIWSLHHEQVSLSEFYERVAAYLREQQALTPQAPALRATLDASGTETFILSPEQALHLYRIIQEAIQNAIKHAGATCIEVTLQTQEEGLTLEIRDDGCFCPSKAQEAGLNGYGLNTMRRRALELGTQLALETKDGTIVRVAVPLGTQKST